VAGAAAAAGAAAVGTAPRCRDGERSGAVVGALPQRRRRGPQRAVAPPPGRARGYRVVRGRAAAAAATAAVVGVVAQPRARGPPARRRHADASRPWRGDDRPRPGGSATMRAGRTPATARLGESPHSLADRACAGDGGGALGGPRAVGRAAGSGAPRRAARGALGGAGRRSGRAAKDGRRSDRGVTAATQRGRAAARAGRWPPRVAAAPATWMPREPPRWQILVLS